MGAIDHDAHSVQCEIAREGAFGVFDVAAQRVIDAHRLADFPGHGPDFFNFSAENQAFDAVFDFVIQLVAVGVEEFYAVVIVGIVRGGDDNAGIGAQTARHVSHARRGQGADQQNIHAHRQHAGGKGVFQHVSGQPGVLADDDLVLAAPAGFRFADF